jgi:hypothetical protein
MHPVCQELLATTSKAIDPFCLPPKCRSATPRSGERGHPRVESASRSALWTLVSPVFGEMTGATLGAVAQSHSYLSVPFSLAHDLLSNQMSRRLKVRRELNAPELVPMWLFVRHGPGVPAL